MVGRKTFFLRRFGGVRSRIVGWGLGDLGDLNKFSGRKSPVGWNRPLLAVGLSKILESSFVLVLVFVDATSRDLHFRWKEPHCSSSAQG